METNWKSRIIKKYANKFRKSKEIDEKNLGWIKNELSARKRRFRKI